MMPAPHADTEILETAIVVVSRTYGVTAATIFSNDRHKNAVAARHVAMYLVRGGRRRSYTTVGILFGRDHTTVIHAVKCVRREAKADPMFRQLLTHLANEASIEIDTSPMLPFRRPAPTSRAGEQR